MYTLNSNEFDALVIGCIPVEGQYGQFYNIAFRTTKPIQIDDTETANVFSVASKTPMPENLLGHNVRVTGVALYAATDEAGETIRHKDGAPCVNGSILPGATIKDLGVPGFRFLPADEPAGA